MEHLSHFDRQHQGEGEGGDDQEDGAESQEKGAEADTVLAESCDQTDRTEVKDQTLTCCVGQVSRLVVLHQP